MDRLTKGAVEADVANAVVRFHREQQGRGPADVRAHLIGDLIVIRCRGVFTQTEAHLATTEEGRRLIRSARQELRSISHREIEDAIADIAACRVVRSYCDLDVDAAEQMEVYVLDADLEKRLLRLELDKLGRLSARQAE